MNVTANQTKKEFKKECKRIMHNIALYDKSLHCGVAEVAAEMHNIKNALNGAWLKRYSK